MEAISQHLHITHPISYEGNRWELFIVSLATPQGISTKLTKEDSSYGSAIWLDWHNILRRPDRARINLLVELASEKENTPAVSFENPYQRTKDILDSIQLYESIMKERRGSYSPDLIEEMAKECTLPKPKIVLLDAESVRISNFLRKEGFCQGDDYVGSFEIPWEKLVEMAQTGHLPLF